MIEALHELRRLVYDRAADSMYLGRSTREAHAEHWKPMGPNLIRYDKWRDERHAAWHEVLPHEQAKSGHEFYEPFDFAVEAITCLSSMPAACLHANGQPARYRPDQAQGTFHRAFSQKGGSREFTESRPHRARLLE